MTRSASKTRSASPSTPPADDVEVVGGGESLTMKKLDKQNQLEGQPEKRNVKVVYKYILNLDAITPRLAIKTCALSILKQR